ncbi:hypothetical protein RHMOL_Rhmol01G0114300 [Rhododendron molle]|uniref:Uncharacterized protein n=1 Tax=Rhododendron molle TaxID=49168 RepID=A0ACC0Q273_RHOML|nr:hypothetical protein RHMOL_Rhmol01G0114300 [Rhododendron molle]
MELRIESPEKLVENPGSKSELMIQSLRNLIRLLRIVSSSTCGTPNSHFSACAQIYLSIVYKLEKNHKFPVIRRLLPGPTCFLNSGSIFFFPTFCISRFGKINFRVSIKLLEYFDKGKKMKVLSKAYNDQMDIGTTQFALYRTEWLKVGAQAPPVPSVPLPSRIVNGFSRRRSLASFTSRSSVNKSLKVFKIDLLLLRPDSVMRRSMELDNTSRASINPWDFEEAHGFIEADHQACTHEDDVKQHCYPEVPISSQNI